jgi:hypothetical protein
VAVILARELGEDFTVAPHDIFFGDAVVGCSPFVAVREIHKLFPPVVQRVSEAIHASPPLRYPPKHRNG